MSNNNLTPSSLRVIRLALLGGVLLFGGVIYYLHSTGSAAGTTLDLTAAPWIFLLLCMAVAGGILALRAAQASAATFAQRASLAIVAWALGEGVALVGGVHWLLTGRVTLYVAGLAVFLAALVTVNATDD